MAVSRLHEWNTNDKLVLLQGWARDGLTMEQIAHNMGVNKTTLYDWMHKDVNLSNALKVGRDIADYAVENALYKNATANMNVTAQIFWLKNRKPESWNSVNKNDLTEDKSADILVEAILKADENGKNRKTDKED